jgi:hypothetical protein
VKQITPQFRMQAVCVHTVLLLGCASPYCTRHAVVANAELLLPSGAAWCASKCMLM